MARLITALFALGMLLLTTTQALADDAARLGVRLLSVVSGKQMPAIVLEPQEDVRSVVVGLKRGDGRVSKVQAVGVKAGTKKELSVQQEAGAFDYVAEFKVTWGDGGSSTFKMKFSLTRTEKLALTLSPENVDLDKRTMIFSINNPAQKAELIIMGKDGKELRKVTKALNNAKPGTDLSLTYPDPQGEILYMDLKVYDVAGFWTGVRLTPLFAEVPHDDVEFDSGKWNIKSSEEPKLERTRDLLKKEIEKFQKHNASLGLRLYIAGYTDTVGSKAANQTLSNNRARSIASWFRKNGIRVPIFYQGFGEDVPAVKTPDETDEQKNRRALYILSSQTPSKSYHLPKDSWTKI
ncbi:MAG: OmpA family protein [Myxococcales bacterium]|mgnify:CR=1 FL=1|nr:OmpA family protein [Myxococcales bacterium]